MTKPVPVPLWSEGYLADLAALHGAEQLQPDGLSGKVLLGRAEYEVLLRVLKDMLSVRFPSDRSVVHYLIQVGARCLSLFHNLTVTWICFILFAVC